MGKAPVMSMIVSEAHGLTIDALMTEASILALLELTLT